MSDLNIIEVITGWQQSHEYHACALQSEVVDERNALSNVVGYIGKIEEDNKRLREALSDVIDGHHAFDLSGMTGLSHQECEKIISLAQTEGA